MKAAPNPDVLRAAKLSRIPGITIAEACERFHVAKSAVSRARREHKAECEISIEEIALAALTKNGTEETGTLTGLEHIASYVDYVNHDNCSASEVLEMIRTFEASGHLMITGQTWTLVKPWP